VIDAKGRRLVAYGSLAKDDQRPLNGDTIFEIGSITKVFTSLVLMNMVQKGEVAVTDPVSKYLPVSIKVPERNGRKITLQDLSTQSSGLPRMPANFQPKDPLNPFANYSVEQLYQFISGYHLTRDIGSQYEYSNLGVGLLGHVLALRAGTDYAAMAEEISIRRPAGSPDLQIAYAWHVQTKNGNSIIWHNGGTGGYGTYMGFDAKTRAGVVVLSNIATTAGPDDIGRHLLDSSYPLEKVEPFKEHTEVTVDPRIFDNSVGTYQLTPNAIMTISRDGDQLFGQLTGQQKLQ
jgi:CubicO group peptidase (beta-lactamase class C family)